MATHRKQFIIAVSLYTFGGLLSSTLVGLTVASAGWLVSGVVPIAVVAGLGLALAAGVVALVRELLLPGIPLLQMRRQTPYRWIYAFPLNVTSLLWGFDLGTLFSTYVTFAGIWPLTVALFALAEPALGAGLFAAYWLGKAATIWLSPLWVEDDHSAEEVAEAIVRGRRLLSLVHCAGLIAVLAGCALALFWLWR